MPDRDPTVADKIIRRLNILTGMTVIVAIALIGIVFYFGIQAGQAHDALCHLRESQVRQLAQSRQFLKDHPEGAPSLGYTAAQIQAQIDRSQKAVEALNDLGCPPVQL